MNLEYAQGNLVISNNGHTATIFIYIKTQQYQPNNQQHRVKLKQELLNGVSYPIFRMTTRFRHSVRVKYQRLYHDKANRKYYMRIKLEANALFPQLQIEDWMHGDTSIEHLNAAIQQSK